MIVVPTATWTHSVFDLLSWCSGSILGWRLYRWRFAAVALRIAGQTGPGYFLALGGGAAIGAWASGSFNTLRDAAPALSHSIVGALVGGIVAVEIYKALRGIVGSTGILFVGPFALGTAIGRWGCLFAGLPDRTYGTPSDFPWAVDLGDGIGRHPVQLYESLAMALFLVFFLTGLARRAAWAERRGFYVLCAFYGLQRFGWECLKPYPPLLFGLNPFHLLCLGLIVYGWIYFFRDRARERGRDREVAAA